MDSNNTEPLKLKNFIATTTTAKFQNGRQAKLRPWFRWGLGLLLALSLWTALPASAAVGITSSCGGCINVSGTGFSWEGCNLVINADCQGCQQVDICFFVDPSRPGCSGIVGGQNWSWSSTADALGLRLDTSGTGGIYGCAGLRIASAAGPLKPGVATISGTPEMGVAPISTITIEVRTSSCCGSSGNGITGSTGCTEPPPPTITPTLPPISIRRPLLTKGGELGFIGTQQGDVDVELGSVSLVIPLGAKGFGFSAGALHIHEPLPRAELATPRCLQFAYSNSLNVVVTNADGIRQIHTPDAFVNVVFTNATRYYLNFYRTNAITGSNSGLYTFSGIPIATVTVENTNSAGSTTNTLRITDRDGYIYDYVYRTNGVTNVWELTTGTGLCKQVHYDTWSGTNLVVRAEILNSAGDCGALGVTTYASNAPSDLRLLTKTLGDGSAARTSGYSYTPGGRVQQATNSSGSWSITHYDTNGRVAVVFSAYGTEGPTTNASLCRQIEYSYDQSLVNGSGDTNLHAFSHPRRTIERIYSNEVRRTYFVGLEFEHRDIVCVHPGAAWDNASNLVTVTRFVSETNLFYGRPRSVLRPDGTATLYFYETNASGHLTTTVASGQPGNAGLTNIVDGTTNITVTGNFGQPISETVIDCASGIVLSSLTFGNYDDFHRPRQVTLLDTSIETTDYGCCGPTTITTRDGSVLSHRQDPLKRYTSTTYAGVITTNILDAAGRLLMETNASGVLSGVALLHAYDALGRRTNVSVHNSSTPLLQHSYAYDAASRLTNAADGPFNATYAYLANSPLVSQITHRSNSVTAMTTTKSYDYLNRLLSIANVPAAAGETPITYAYLYNDANQRTRRTDPDDSYWLYEYDPLGQLTSGKHYWQDHTPVAGQQFEYAYDDIGNRTSTKEGGDASGAGLRSATYGANNLNQYTNRTVPGAADITGIAHAIASVTVNSLSTYRKDEYFWKELSLANTNAPVWTNVSIVASLTGTNQTNTGSLLHPKATESFLFDADGNQTSDSLWTNSWDGENRLIATESSAGVPAGGKARQTWTLDGQSRWVHRVVHTWNGSAYVASATNRFLWDGKVLLAILNHTNGIEQSYLRGLDLSGSLQGAGGAGGVLAVNMPTNGIHFLAYDGNGNVAGLANATTGATSGDYAYDPFANTLQVSGAAAQANLIRFSTQLADAVSGESKYLYRGLKPPLGRWPSRDPIGEIKPSTRPLFKVINEISLYNFQANSSVASIDYLGLFKWGDSVCAAKWAEQVEVRIGALPIGCAGSAIADAWMLIEGRILPRAYPGYDPRDNGHRALHCLSHCMVAKGCQFGSMRTTKEIADLLQNAGIDYELCTYKTGLCDTFCGDLGRYQEDIHNDLEANEIGINAGLAGEDCIEACRSQTIAPGVNEKFSCRECDVKACYQKWFPENIKR